MFCLDQGVRIPGVRAHSGLELRLPGDPGGASAVRQIAERYVTDGPHRHPLERAAEDLAERWVRMRFETEGENALVYVPFGGAWETWSPPAGRREGTWSRSPARRARGQDNAIRGTNASGATGRASSEASSSAIRTKRSTATSHITAAGSARCSSRRRSSATGGASPRRGPAATVTAAARAGSSSSVPTTGRACFAAASSTAPSCAGRSGGGGDLDGRGPRRP